MKTLPDYLGDNLLILSIGLNPSLSSVAAGYYFAGRNNRFWPTLNASGLSDRKLTPGAAACEYLCRKRRIGFTDVVKRPSRGAAGLCAADFRQWVPHLENRINRCRPAVLWFHGKLASRRYLHWRGQSAAGLDWGLQPEPQQGAQVFLSPNPSAANAAFTLADLTAYYGALYRLYRVLAGKAAD